MPWGAACARRLLVLVPILCATAAAAATASRAGAASTPRTGRQIYLADCATCHGSDARGTSRGPTLVGAGSASIDFMVRTGRMPLASPTAPMRRSTPAYTSHELRRLVDYTSGLAGPTGPGIPRLDAAPADLSAGGATYRLDCAACHSWAGNGGALVGQAAPSVTEASPREIAEAVRSGPGTMPVFGPAALPDRQLGDLVAFTDHLDHPDDRGGWALGHLGPMSEGALAIVVGLGLLVTMVRWLGERR